MMNPFLDIMSNQSIYINDIIEESKRWETILNRREPVTKGMIKYIIVKGKSLSKSNPHNMYFSLRDWLVLGEQTGFKRKMGKRSYLFKEK